MRASIDMICIDKAKQDSCLLFHQLEIEGYHCNKKWYILFPYCPRDSNKTNFFEKKDNNIISPSKILGSYGTRTKTKFKFMK